MLPKENNTPKSIFNPLKEDFKFMWDGEPHIIGSIQVQTYPTWLADHAAQALARKIAVDGDPNVSFDIRYEKALKEVTV